jgi:hypothetical protein
LRDGWLVSDTANPALQAPTDAGDVAVKQ